MNLSNANGQQQQNSLKKIIRKKQRRELCVSPLIAINLEFKVL